MALRRSRLARTFAAGGFALVAVASCGAAPGAPTATVVRTIAIDADRDGHPEDLQVRVVLPRVPTGEWIARASLASGAAAPAAGRDADLPGHPTPASEHRALERPEPFVATGAACTLSFYFRGDDVAALAPRVPHALRVLLHPRAPSREAGVVRQYDGIVRVDDPAAFLQAAARVWSGTVEPGGRAARVDVQCARPGTLIVQASVVAGVTAIATGRAEVRAAGRRTVRVPLAPTPEAGTGTGPTPRRLVVEVIRPADAVVIATWDRLLARDGAK